MTFKERVILLIVGILMLGVAYFLFDMQLNARLERAEKRRAEAVEFKKADAVVAQPMSPEELVKLVNSTMKEEFRQLKRAVPSATPTAYAQIETKPIEGKVIVETPAEADTDATPARSEFVVAFKAKGRALTVEGDAGAEALKGTVELFQIAPGPERYFGMAPFEADASKLFKPPKEPEVPLWRAELRGGLDTDFNLRVGGTFYRGERRFGYWTELDYPLQAGSSRRVAGGIAWRLEGRAKK